MNKRTTQLIWIIFSLMGIIITVMFVAILMLWRNQQADQDNEVVLARTEAVGRCETTHGDGRRCHRVTALQGGILPYLPQLSRQRRPLCSHTRRPHHPHQRLSLRSHPGG